MLSWIFFHRIEVNAIILIVDLIQMAYYFLFESIWSLSRDQVEEAMKKQISLAYDCMHTCKALLEQRGYSEKAIQEIWKWYDLS